MIGRHASFVEGRARLAEGIAGLRGSFRHSRSGTSRDEAFELWIAVSSLLKTLIAVH